MEVLKASSLNMTKYSYVVAADRKYLPELTALLNSLDFIGNKFDVELIDIRLPKGFTAQLSKLSYKVIDHKISEKEIEESHGISEVACRKRYWYASKWNQDREATCILDADMIFVRNPFQFFEMAAKTGYILGVTKEQNKVYDNEHHKFKGKWLIPKGTWNDKDLCNCPLFLDARIWGKALEDSWRWFFEGFPKDNFKAPDMDAMNIAFLKHNAKDKIVKLPGLQWLGTNEQLLKPYVRVAQRRDNKFWTENGLEIFSYHGQFYHKDWRETQLANRHRCAESYLGCSEHTDSIAKDAMNLLYNHFMKMLDFKIKIEHKDWRHEDY